MNFFENFPIVNYNGISLRNIMLKSKIFKDVLDQYDVYHPYIIEDWERPDTIAADYYKDSKYHWVVLLANDIVDPYYQWPLSYEDLMSFIQKKHGMSPEQLKTDIKHYEYTGIGGDTTAEISRKSWVMPTTTYDLMTAEEKSGWTAVYTYDWEVEQNDAKRSIKLLDSSYLHQIDKELSVVFNG